MSYTVKITPCEHYSPTTPDVYKSCGCGLDIRPKWDDYFLSIAQTVSLRGDCRRSQVGAVLVQRDNHTVFIGYNGTPQPGQPGCLLGHCPRGLLTHAELPSYADYRSGPGRCIGVHAEENALKSCLKNGGNSLGSKVYVTRAPCHDCKDLLFTHGVDKVLWADGHLDNVARL